MSSSGPTSTTTSLAVSGWPEVAFRSVLDSLSMGVVIVDGSGRLAYTNRAAFALMSPSRQLPPDLTIDRWPSAFGIYDADGRALLPAHELPVTRALRGETVEDVRVLVRNARRPRGVPMWVTARPVPCPSGQASGAMVLFDDLTARIKAEREEHLLADRIRESQRLESLAVLAGGIAHDFNNLLVGVLGNADAAAAALPRDSPAREPISHVSEAALRAAELARQMLAYAGQGRFVIEPISLSRLVRQMVDLLRTLIPKNIDLHLDLAEGLPQTEGDVTQLRQVVMNLITNASDACRDRGGLITIRTGAAEHSAEWLHRSYGAELQPGYYLTLEVEDDGVGMDPETRRHIFDPFFTTKPTGRGLGLAAALGIIRSLQGAIRVQSEPRRGTLFRVLLPATRQRRRSHSGPVPIVEDTWRGSGLVLLVDDEPLVRSASSRMLRSIGFTVAEAADGEEALDWLREHPGQAVLVLLDMSMPKLSGAAVFAQIRRMAPALPVVMSSGRERSDVLEALHEKGLAGFLPKPYRLSELRAALRLALTGDEGIAS